MPTILKALLTMFALNFLVLGFAQNLIPNGSFEEFTRTPRKLGDFYPKHWFTISSYTSPDLYSIRSPKSTAANPNWQYCGVQPKHGLSFVGLILDAQNSTYRENIGVKLTEPLIADSTYIFKIAVAVPKIARFRTTSLDVLLTNKPIFVRDNFTIVEIPASINVDLNPLQSDGSWAEFSYEYKASGGETYLSIGNFKSKKKTKTHQIPHRKKGIYKIQYNQAYVAIDEVQLYQKISPIEVLETPELPVHQELIDTIILNGITFKVGSAEIESDQASELEKLLEFMLKNQLKKIEIVGHTDNTGNEENNIELSQNRAKSVKHFLVNQGVDENRITTNGKGSSQPIDTNDTPEGRRKNRRIEVLIK